MLHPDPSGYLLRQWRSSDYGPRPGLFGVFHPGIDFAFPQGSPLYATRAGRVAVDDDDSSFDGANPATWSGIAVIVDHGDGHRTWFAHMRSNIVFAGQQVARGELLGWVGSTGAATGPHLHFQHDVLVNGIWVHTDPEEELMALSEEGQAAIRQIVREELTAQVGPGSALVVEVVGAVKGGFDETVPVLLNRLAAGDKDVRDSDVDVQPPPSQ